MPLLQVRDLVVEYPGPVRAPKDGIWVWLRNLYPMMDVSATPDWPVGWWLRYPAAMLYLLLGAAMFRWLEAQAKKRGMIGKCEFFFAIPRLLAILMGVYGIIVLLQEKVKKCGL